MSALYTNTSHGIAPYTSRKTKITVMVASSISSETQAIHLIDGGGFHANAINPVTAEQAREMAKMLIEAADVLEAAQ